MSISVLQDLIASQREDISALKEDIYTLKMQHQQAMPVAADASQYSPLQPKKSTIPLNLPLTKVIDLYMEMPQALTAYAYRTAVVEAQGENIVIERNNLGNYWVIQVQEKGFFLFPRPNDFKRLALLMSLKEVFSFENYQPDNLKFSLKSPGKLQVRVVEKKWQLEKKVNLFLVDRHYNFSGNKSWRRLSKFRKILINYWNAMVKRL